MSNRIDMEQYSGRTVLVTGGAGFIGSHLVRRLVNLDAHVIVIEDFSTSPRTYIEDVEEEIQLIESDVANVSRPLPGFSEIESIFHLAAFTYSARGEEDPMTTHRANTTGTLRVLEIARQIEPEVTVMMGSSVRGGSIGVSGKGTTNSAPSSLYAATKGAMELYTAAYVRRFSVPGIVLRPSCVYGPRQPRDRGYTQWMSSFIEHVLTGATPELPAQEGQEMDYIYVRDVVEALLLAGYATDLAGEGFDICSGHSVSPRELIKIIADVSEKEVDEPVISDRKGDYSQRSDMDPEPANQELNFEAAVSLREGIKQTVEWFDGRV